jgi:hypothetical protein
MWFTYVYAVKLPSGRLVRAGQDFGPTLDTYKVGDSLGIKNGKEGIVLAVVKGEDAKLNGADVLIIVEEKPAKVEGQPIAKTILQMSQELQSPRLTSRPFFDGGMNAANCSRLIKNLDKTPISLSRLQ